MKIDQAFLDKKDGRLPWVRVNGKTTGNKIGFIFEDDNDNCDDDRHTVVFFERDRDEKLRISKKHLEQWLPSIGDRVVDYSNDENNNVGVGTVLETDGECSVIRWDYLPSVEQKWPNTKIEPASPDQL